MMTKPVGICSVVLGGLCFVSSGSSRQSATVSTDNPLPVNRQGNVSLPTSPALGSVLLIGGLLLLVDRPKT
jgi:hypothetical protein